MFKNFLIFFLCLNEDIFVIYVVLLILLFIWGVVGNLFGFKVMVFVMVENDLNEMFFLIFIIILGKRRVELGI